MNSPIKNNKYNPLVKLFVVKAFSFLDYKEFAMFEHLSKIKSTGVIEKCLGIMEENNFFSHLSTNLCIVEGLEELCSCSVNSTFKHIVFVSSSNDNDFSSWNRILSRREEGKIRLQSYLLFNRRNYEEVFNHLVHIIAGEFLRFSAEEVILAIELLTELYYVKFLMKNNFVSCEADLAKCNKKHLRHSLKLKFEPQIFSDFNVNVQLQQETREFLQGVTQRVSDTSNRIINSGIDINHFIDDDFLEILRNLKDTKIKIEHGLDDKSTEILGSLIDRLDSSISCFKSDFNDVFKNIGVYIPVVLIGIIIILFPKYEAQTRILISVVSLLVAFLFPKIKDTFMKIINKICDYHGQNNFNLVEDFVTLGTMMVLGRDYKHAGILNSFKKLKDYERYKIGTSNFFKDIFSLFQKLLNHILDYFGKERYIFFDVDHDLLGSYLEDVNSFIEGHSLDSHLTFDDGNILALLEKRDSELNKLLTSPLDRQKLYHARRALDPYLTKKRAMSWFGQSYRTEPTAIIMTGESHIGKSTVMLAMLHEITARLLSDERLKRFKENPGSEIFSWNWEREHADGYNRQFNTTIDDIGCTKDVAGVTNNVYSATMKMVNAAPYLLNMAELTSKADSYFSSEFVWMTTNRENWDLSSMFYNEAFVNRLRIGLQLKLKEGFAKPNNNNIEYSNFEHLTFNLIEFDKRGVRGPTVIRELGGYEEARDFILSFHNRKQEKGDKIRDTITRFIERGSAMRGQIKLFSDKDRSQYLSDLGTIPTTQVLANVTLLGALWYTNVKYIQPYVSKFIFTGLQKLKENIAGYKQDEMLVELPPNERTLTETLDQKKISSHFITQCTCPYCSPHILLKSVQDVVDNYQQGITQLPHSFQTIIWRFGFTTDEHTQLFGQSLFYFLFSRKYEELFDQRYSNVIVDLPNGDLRPYFISPQDIETILERVVSSWGSSEPVPLCVSAPESTWERIRNMENYAVFVAFCCSFYIKRLYPTIDQVTFKNRIKTFCRQPYFIEHIRKLVDPFITGLTFLGGLSVSFALYYGYGKINEYVGKKRMQDPLFKAYGFDNLENGTAKYNKSNDKIDLNIKQYFFVDDRKLLCNVLMTIPKVTNNLPTFFAPSHEIVIDDVGFYKTEEDEEWKEIDFSIADKIELYIGANSPHGMTLVGLKINHPTLVAREQYDFGEPRKVVAQSSTGLKNVPPIRRKENVIAMKGQSIDISKFMSGYDKSNRDIGKKIYNGNVLLLYLPNKDCSHMTLEEYEKHLKSLGRSCSILMLADRIGLINDHVKRIIYYALKEGYVTESHPVMLLRASDPIAVPYYWVPKEKEFYNIDRFAQSDIAVVKLPETLFQSFKNIKKYFVSNKMPISSEYQGVLYVPKEKMQLEIFSTYFKKGSVDFDDYQNGEVWIYPVATQNGDCGSILTINDKFSGSKKICGFHIAGNGVFRGSSFPLFSEDIDAILKFFHIGGGVKIPQDDIDYEEVTVEEQLKFPYTYIAQVKIPAIPFRSRIKPAPLHDVGEITHVPASSKTIIVDNKKVNPAMNALWKNIPASQPLSLEKLELLFKFLLKFYEQVSVVDRERRVNTFEECVLGIENDPYYRSMSRGTSAGIPYKIDLAKPGLKGKQVLFGTEEKFDLNHPGCLILKKDVEDELSYMRKGKRHIIPYEVSEKDECLPKEKVAEGKIRLFAVNSALAGVLKRMYGGQFRSWFGHNRIYNGSAIGINVYSLDWDFLCKHLLFGKKESDKPCFIAMDVSKFDGTVNRPWMYCFFQMVCDWYNFPEKERKIQMEIFETQMHNFHVFKGKLFERIGSQSSGDEYTALLNTVISQGYAYYAILLIMTQSIDSIIKCDDLQMVKLMEEIQKYVRIIALGDDIVISINSEWQWYGIVTEAALIETYNRFGVNATTDSKDGSVYTYRFLKDITFLKRKTYFCNETNRYIGKLEVSSIMKSIQWMRDNDPHYEAYRLTLQHALEELALHDDPVFYRFVAQIAERGRERVHLNLLSYEKGWLKRQCLLREDFF